VVCQVTAYAVPCKQNARWFSDGDFSRIHHSRGPVSRVYAVVLEAGQIAGGDTAILEPAHPDDAVRAGAVTHGRRTGDG
jgi:MOSC domain-containing protein YiiM